MHFVLVFDLEAVAIDLLDAAEVFGVCGIDLHAGLDS
jgi:hypothetical protein